MTLTTEPQPWSSLVAQFLLRAVRNGSLGKPSSWRQNNEAISPWCGSPLRIAECIRRSVAVRTDSVQIGTVAFRCPARLGPQTSQSGQKPRNSLYEAVRALLRSSLPTATTAEQRASRFAGLFAFVVLSSGNANLRLNLRPETFLADPSECGPAYWRHCRRRRPPKSRHGRCARRAWRLR